MIREVGPGADPAGLAASSDTDVLVVAGGDGTVSAVAAVAVERDLPLVVLPCGTLNHFAADAGLDRNDPLTGMAAVEDGTELRVDVGSVNGRVFINNASIGFYSSMVQDPQYRSRRVAVTSRYLRRAILGGGTTMTVSLTSRPEWLCPIRPDDPGLQQRLLARCCTGRCVAPSTGRGSAVGAPAGAQRAQGAAPLAVGPDPRHVVVGTLAGGGVATREQTVGFTGPVRVGLDGEAVELTTPLQFSADQGRCACVSRARSGRAKCRSRAFRAALRASE